MPINYPQFRQLSPEEMGGYGGIDLAKSIQSGLQNANLFQETRFKKRNLENSAYAQELANKINEAKARYAMDQALADLQYKQAGTTNLGAQSSHLGAQTRGINIENQYLPEKLQLANSYSKLKNQYYGPNIQSEINQRNAMTQGQNIQNQYLPENLQLGNKIKAAEARFANLKQLSDLMNSAYTREHVQSQTTGQNIENKFAPERLGYANKVASAQAQYAPQKELASLQNTQAQTQGYAETAKGQRIENEYLPEKLRNSNKVTETQAKYAEKREIMDLLSKRIGNEETRAQIKQLNLSNKNTPEMQKWQIQLLKAQEQLAQANADKAKTLSGLYGSVINGQPSGTIGNQQGPQNYVEQLSSQGFNQNQPQGINQNQANLAAGLLHLPVSSQVVNGQLITNNPLSGISSTKVGPTAEETAFATGMGKGKSEEYNTAVKNYNALQNQGLALSELANAAENNPEFRNVTGRINQPLTNWFGTEGQKELLGRLQSSSGEITLQVAPSLKGAFTGRDQSLINTIKASPNDFPDVFIGKLKAQTLINNVLMEREKLRAEYLEKNYSSIEASKKAAQETPLEKFKPQVDKLITHQGPLTAEQLQRAKLELSRRKGAI